MNRNQKIALGCGAAGCLGLILLAVIAAIFFLIARRSGSAFDSNRSSNTNVNFNTNRSSNRNSNSTTTSDRASSMSDDDKHKLFQAAAATKDTDVLQRVWKRLGLANADGTPNDEYGPFVKEHVVWMFRNTDFLQTVDTPEKARAYVDAHL